MKRIRVYISGPMTDLPREEYMRRFKIAEDVLKGNGYLTINPCRVWACRWPWLYKIVGYRLTLLYDLLLLLTRADNILLLPEWNHSRGASIENYVATEFRIPCVDKNIVHCVRNKIVNLSGSE